MKKSRSLLALSVVIMAYFSGAAYAACNTAQLAGSWDFIFTDPEGVGYCKGLQFTSKGGVRNGKGACRLFSVESDGRQEILLAKPKSGKIQVTSGCSIKVNKSNPGKLGFTTQSETLTTYVTNGRLSSDGKSLIMMTEDPDDGWSLIWQGIKK